MKINKRLIYFLIILIIVPLVAAGIDIDPVVTITPSNTTVETNVSLVAVAQDMGDNKGIRWIRIYESGTLYEEESCSNTASCTKIFNVVHPFGESPTTKQYYVETEDLGGHRVSSSTVSVKFNGPNLNPWITGDGFSYNEDTGLHTINLDNYADDNRSSDTYDEKSELIFSVIDQSAATVIDCNVSQHYLECTTQTDQFGVSNVTVQVQDTDGATSTAVFSLEIEDVNDAPRISNIGGFNLTYNGSLWVDLSTYIIDIEGDDLSYTVDGNNNVNVFIVNDTANISSINWNGTETLTITAEDDRELSTTSNDFNVTVFFISTGAPEMKGTNLTITEDSKSNLLNLSLLSYDEDGNSIQYFVVEENDSLECALNENTLNATPAANYSSVAYCTIIAGDRYYNSTAVNISYNVTGVNDAPTFRSEISNYTITFNSSLVINLSNYFYDIDGDVLNYSVTDINNFSVVFRGDIVNITPNPTSFVGRGNLTFRANDTDNFNATSNVVYINVTAESTAAPILDDADVALTEDSGTSSLNLTPLTSDIDDNRITYNLIRNTTGIFCEVYDDLLNMTPQANFSGTAYCLVNAFDGFYNSSTANYTIEVGNVQDNITTNLTTLTLVIDENKNATIELLSMFYDPDEGDPRTYEIYAGDNFTYTTDYDTTDNITIVPDRNFNGLTWVIIQASDGLSLINSTNITINVTNINDLPREIEDNIGVFYEDINRTLNMSSFYADEDNTDLNYTVTSGDNLTFEVDNVTDTIKIIPLGNWSGTSWMIFNVTDGINTTTGTNFTVTVNPVNDAPYQNDSLASIVDFEDNNATFVLYEYFNDVDNEDLNYSVEHGSNAMFYVDNSTDNLTIIPDENFNGSTWFIITATDGELSNTSNNISYVVMQVNDAPEFDNIPDIAGTEDVNVSLNLSNFITDVENDDINFTANYGPNLTLHIDNTTNTVILEPDNEWNGTSWIIFNATDGQASNLSNNVTLDFAYVNDAPRLSLDVISINEDSSAIVNLSIYTTDADNSVGDINYTYQTSGQLNIILSNATKLVNITPSANIFGNYTINFTVLDPIGSFSSHIVTVNITGIDDAPTLQNSFQNMTIPAGKTTSISLLSYFEDVDNDDLNFTVPDVQNFTIVVDNATDMLYLTPDINFTGNKTLNVTVTDARTNVTSNNFIIFVGGPTTEVVNSQINGTTVTPDGNYTNYTGAFSTETIFVSVVHDSTVADESKINNSVLNVTHVQNSTIVDSTVYNGTINKSRIENSTVLDSDIIDAIIIDSFVDPSDTTGSTLIGMTNVSDGNATYSVVTNSNITNSDVNNSVVTGSSIVNSTMYDSNATSIGMVYCRVFDSDLGDSNFYNCVMNSSSIYNSTVQNSTFLNVTMYNTTLIDEREFEDAEFYDMNVTNGTATTGVVIFNGTVFNVTKDGPKNLSDMINFAPEASFLANPTTITKGNDVTFTAVGNDDNVGGDLGDVITYKWDFGDSTPIQYTTSSVIVHKFDNPGTYTVTMTALDNFGKSVVQTTAINVNDEGSPRRGGGGGGGGGGRYAREEFITISSYVWTIKYAMKGDTYNFEFNGTNHSIEFNEVSEMGVNLTVDDENVFLKPNSTGKFNLNGDNTYDLAIKVIRLRFSNGQLGFMYINELDRRPRQTDQPSQVEEDQSEVDEEIGKQEELVKDGIIEPDEHIEDTARDMTQIYGIIVVILIVVLGLGAYLLLNLYD